VNTDRATKVLEKNFPQEQVQRYVEFANERLGAEWADLFRDDDSVVEDMDLFLKAGNFEAEANLEAPRQST
jgi:hypothetical protein